jgi:hypothetical protein
MMQKKKARSWTPAQKANQSKKMRAYWAARKENEQKPEPWWRRLLQSVFS